MSVSHSFAPSLRAEREHRQALALVTAGGQEDAIAPDDGRRVAAGRARRPSTARRLVGDQRSVYCPAGTWPCPDGPRQRDQYFAPSPVTSIIFTSAGAADTDATASRPKPSQIQRFIGPILEHRWPVSSPKPKASRIRAPFTGDQHGLNGTDALNRAADDTDYAEECQMPSRLESVLSALSVSSVALMVLSASSAAPMRNRRQNRRS